MIKNKDFEPFLKDLLTKKEGAAWLGVDEKTLYRWRKMGLIPFILMPTGTIRYRESDLKAFVESGILLRQGIPGHSRASQDKSG